MWIQISSGRGPIECERAVLLFVESLVKELKVLGVELSVVQIEKGLQKDGLKSALLSLKQEDAKKVPSDLEGTILWQCKSKYRKETRRKNWFVVVNFLQEVEMLESDLKQIEFSSMRSSGAGGQNVNKVETGVRAVYLPLNINVVATEERSQYANKKLAIARIMEKIKMQNEQKEKNAMNDMWQEHNNLVRGNQVRSYQGENFVRIN